MGGVQPLFGELKRSESIALLRRNGIGRLAYSRRGVVTIEPIHYVLRGEWIFARTAPGQKLEAVSRNPWVAFEVDEVAGLFDWKSVVVRGTLYRPDPEGSSDEVKLHQKGVRALRTVIPQTFLPDDPVPFRDVILAIYVQELSGRWARSGR